MKVSKNLVFGLLMTTGMTMTAACGDGGSESQVMTAPAPSALDNFLSAHHSANDWSSVQEKFEGIKLSPDEINHDFSQNYAENKTIEQYDGRSLEYRSSEAKDATAGVILTQKNASFSVQIPTLNYDLLVRYPYKTHAIKAEAKGIALTVDYRLNDAHTEYQVVSAGSVAIESLILSGEATGGHQYHEQLKGQIEASLLAATHNQVKAFLKGQSKGLLTTQLAAKAAACAHAEFGWNKTYQIGDKVIFKGKAYEGINEGNNKGNPPGVSTWFWKETAVCS